MFYLDLLPDDPPGYRVLSLASHWVRWIAHVLPPNLDRDVRERLKSNLKHVLVGLEMKGNRPASPTLRIF